MDALGMIATLHGLRHTHASRLITAGMDVLMITRRIGHASPEITLRVYGDLFSNTDAGPADTTDATFSKVSH